MTHLAENHTVPQAETWPDLSKVPSGPIAALRAGIARRLLEHAVRHLPLRVVLPDGSTLGAGGPADPTMHIVRPEAFFRRLGGAGLIGFGEAYMVGDWTSHEADQSDLANLLTVLAHEISLLVPERLQRFRAVAVPRLPNALRNTLHGSRRNIERHYDLSNDLFATFLDPTMTYSSAIFPGTGPDSGSAPHAEWADLEAAQHRKIDRLLDATGVGEGTRLLEIGTGWGELSLRAAGRGAAVHSITLSKEQAELARHRISAHGLADRVTVELRDYRQIDGEYDAVISVEMIEAVGAEYLQTYFDSISRVLRPGGRLGLQAITMAHHRMLATRNTFTWIHKYIFPGGLIPSMEAMTRAAGNAGLRPGDDVAFGRHYGETLRLWRQRFNGAESEVREQGFDHIFLRMWNFYLAYSEAGFGSGYLDVHQRVFTRIAR